MMLAIASGKGGTGKTLVATSLALALKDEYAVQLLDCDVEEPNAHIFLQPEIEDSRPVAISVPAVDESKCTLCGRCSQVCAFNALAVTPAGVLIFPELCHGCGACSYLCPEKAISEVEHNIGVVETGRADGIAFVQGRLDVGQAMAPPVIRQVKKLADDSKLVIIDAAPGTSCPVVEAVRGSDFCLLVTEPTPFGLNDLKMAVETIRQLDIPCGVIINRAGSGDNQTEEYCHKEKLPIMMTIPLDSEIAGLYSRGIPLVAGKPEYKSQFIDLFHQIEEVIDAGNRNPER
jgi:MinD superfamily P-loop ATPase